MNRPWLLAMAAVLAALLAAHAPSLPAALRGDHVYAWPLDTCDAHFASAAAPAPRSTTALEQGGELGHGCDTLYSQRMAWDAWRHVREAWETRTNLVTFLLRDLWQVAIDVRALNLLDLALFVWPARLLLPLGAGLAALHLGLVALAAVSGVVFARLLGASPLAGVAAGIVAGTAGPVMEGVQRGQYPQALLPLALAVFAGLIRCVQGQRGGVALLSLGATAAALAYWQNVLLLVVGGTLFLAVARAAGPFAPGAGPRLIGAGALASVLCLPAAWPVLDALRTGVEEKLATAPWGTAFPADATDPRLLLDLIDEVPWFILLSPRAGWLPVLPLLPVAAYALVGRRDPARMPGVASPGVGPVAIVAAFAVVAAFGMGMALGPLPVVPTGGTVATGYSALGRIANPLYNLVYQWIPTASRMHHPMRWAVLLSVGATALSAVGVDRMRRRWPDHAALAVGAALVWAAVVGPWPLRTAPLPAAELRTLEGCSALVLATQPRGQRALDEVHRLEGLLWLERAPERDAGMGGVGRPTERMTAAAERLSTALHARLDGEPAELGDACVLFDTSWNDTRGPAVHAQLQASFGAPVAILEPTGLFAPGPTSVRIEVFVPRSGHPYGAPPTHRAPDGAE